MRAGVFGLIRYRLPISYLPILCTFVAVFFVCSLMSPILLLPTSGLAQTVNQQSVKLSELESNIPNGSKANQAPEMTNSRMAADLGSPSAWSMRLDLNYQGGSVSDPFGARRPNYRKLAGNPIQDTMLNAVVGLAYRLNPVSQLRFNTGLSYRTPFSNSMDDILNNRSSKSIQANQNLFNVTSLIAEYSYTSRSGNLMYSPSVTLNYSTDSFLTGVVGQLGMLSGTLRIMYEFEKSGWQLGATSFWNQVFYRDEEKFDRRKRARPVSILGIVPIVEYKFNDRWSSRNAIGIINYTHFRHRDPWVFVPESPFIS
ncbi:MAG: hypothetical protein RMK80_06880, partial [Pseudobdellovibrionaceae bacterium]|nr:hypothetical protein [Pseudobdellovibrionaceae bacterium]